MYMKKLPVVLIICFLLATIAATSSSCHRGYGCPINEDAHIQPNKKGKYPKSRTRSGLFPKDMKKRSKTH